MDGLTVADVGRTIRVPGFLDDLRAQLKAGTHPSLPVRERKIRKPGGSGKVRSLSIPTVAGGQGAGAHQFAVADDRRGGMNNLPGHHG